MSKQETTGDTAHLMELTLNGIEQLVMYYYTRTLQKPHDAKFLIKIMTKMFFKMHAIQ